MTAFSEADLKDAGAICGVFAALETANRPRSSQANAARRWAMNGVWAATRCYNPTTMLWSRAAREASTLDPKTKLIREHVVPVNVIREELLSGFQTAEAYAETLMLMMLVVTVTLDEDKRLSRKGHPDPSDPWARYRAAGLDVEGFLPFAHATATPTPAPLALAEPPLSIATEPIKGESLEERKSRLDTAYRAGDKASRRALMYRNGLRTLRESKGYGREAIADALGISTTQWWVAEFVLDPGTPEHEAVVARVTALPLR